jgi:hypothetical protein
VLDLGFVDRGEVSEAQLDEALDVLSMTRPPQASPRAPPPPPITELVTRSWSRAP